MAEWRPMCVLPNAYLHPNDTIELGDSAALVSRFDDRVLEVANEQPMVGEMVNRFRDQFGAPVDPAVLLIREAAPEGLFDTEAVAGLRDALAVCMIPYARARRLTTGVTSGPLWGEVFSVYPWMVNRFGDHLLQMTPAQSGVHFIEEFQGQTDPRLSPATISAADVDVPVFEALMPAWLERFSTSSPQWTLRSLFRALNMAFNATQLPGSTEATFYDVGRIITLWVAAFETLVHTGPNGGGASAAMVADLLDSVSWLDPGCAELVHQIQNVPHTWGTSIYGRIHLLRNDFSHGNPVSPAQMRLGPFSLDLLAGPLFRMALAGRLGVAFPDAPADASAEALGAYIAERGQFRHYQNCHEQVLLRAGAAV